jgi:hypothetical protein
LEGAASSAPKHSSLKNGSFAKIERNFMKIGLLFFLIVFASYSLHADPLDVAALKALGAKGIAGRVVRKSAEGVVVSLAVAQYPMTFTLYAGEVPSKVPYGRIGAPGPPGQLVIVIDLPNADRLVDNDSVNLVGFPRGISERDGHSVRIFSALPQAAK